VVKRPLQLNDDNHWPEFPAAAAIPPQVANELLDPNREGINNVHHFRRSQGAMKRFYLKLAKRYMMPYIQIHITLNIVFKSTF